MKTALVIIVTAMMMLVSCTCVVPPQDTQPAPEQTIPNDTVPSYYKPTEPNPPNQSWNSQHPSTESEVDATVVTYTSPTNYVQHSVPFYGGYYYYTSNPPAPPVTPIIYTFWSSTIPVGVIP